MARRFAGAPTCRVAYVRNHGARYAKPLEISVVPSSGVRNRREVIHCLTPMTRRHRWYDTGVSEIASLWRHRRVLRSLAHHDMRKAYAGTAGGLLWSLITPLVPILIFSAIFSYGIRLPLGKAPYIFGFSAAYVPWTFLTVSITSSSSSLVE